MDGTARSPMIIAVGADHAGFAVKAALVEHLRSRGHEVLDFGTDAPFPPVDYPAYARAVAVAVASGQAHAGILVCGTGLGMAIAANKVRGIRAAVVHDVTTARLARAHNDANVVAIGGRLIAPELAREVMDAYLGATFEPRHQPRLDQIAAMERGETGVGIGATGPGEVTR